MILKLYLLIIFPESRGILDTGVIENLRGRFKRSAILSNLPEITCASSLAHHGLLDSVLSMWLRDFDLTSVPDEHLASLVSRVSGQVVIKNVSGCDLITILGSVKSKVLSIYQNSLGSEETRALLRAMESGVEQLVLYEQVTLDLSVLMEYSGRGKCREVQCVFDTALRYKEQLGTWEETGI